MTWKGRTSLTSLWDPSWNHGLKPYWHVFLPFLAYDIAVLVSVSDLFGSDPGQCMWEHLRHFVNWWHFEVWHHCYCCYLVVAACVGHESVIYFISRQHDLGVKAATSSPRYASCWYSTGKSRCGTGTKSCTDGKGLKVSHVDRGEDGRSNLNCPVRSSAVQRQWYCSVLHRKKYFETLKHSMLWDNIAERALKVSVTPPIALDQD